jgi:uncharacterized protein
MELTNDFRVSVPVDQAWAVLTDLERVGPCLPGAEVQEKVGDDYRGVVRVKVGPVSVQYKGTVRFQEQDDEAHRAVIVAEGRDTRGQGTASALITAVATPEGEHTAVHVVTELTITGKVAQFGRGVLADVSTKLLGQFVERLEHDVLHHEALQDAIVPEEADEGSGSAAGDTEAPPPAPRSTVGAGERAQPEELDLMDIAGASVLKRVLPVVLVVVLLALVFGGRRRRRRRREG